LQCLLLMIGRGCAQLEAKASLAQAREKMWEGCAQLGTNKHKQQATDGAGLFDAGGLCSAQGSTRQMEQEQAQKTCTRPSHHRLKNSRSPL
jgi:hypothetical protein